MFNNFKPKVQPLRHNENKEGCKMRMRRDSSGRIIGYTDNGKCSANQIKAFSEQNNFETKGEEE